MITRRGWGGLAGAVVFGIAGRVLGATELYVMAAGAGALVLMAAASVRSGAGRLDAERVVGTGRVHAGGETRVEVVVTNRSARRAPAVFVADTTERVSGRGPDPRRTAHLQIAPLRPGQSATATYRLPLERGLFRVGPLSVTVTDPFGAAARTLLRGTHADLTVYPRVQSLAPPPHAAPDPRGGGALAAAMGSGDEFYGLRPYQRGDDLRRVHWPSTARMNDLMIRQPEQPWQARTTLMLDTRGGRGVGTDAAGFEAAVSVAASIVSAAWGHDAQVRLLTTSGFDSGAGSGPRHLDALMEHLAVVDRSTGHAGHAGQGDQPAQALARLRRHPAGALAVVSAAPPGPGEAARMPALAPIADLFGWAALVLVGAAAASTAQLPARRVHTVRAATAAMVGPAWRRAVDARVVAAGPARR